MKVHTTNYFNTLIEVAEDCPAAIGEVPLSKGDARSVAIAQYDLLISNPYRFTSDEILFQVFAERKELTSDEMSSAKKAFFSKGQPCFRASPLPKRYGWGIHSNAEGKIALIAADSSAYEALLKDVTVEKVKAMRTKRA
ncbi:MAG: DUF6157 family protein [Bacteroidia bacterium]|nr:DUF6157 family protein [Bacteroidia bacterium]